ncbi:MAG: TetR/AcrR family transcriptional regulator [Gammaproteobacteria bacterium]|nr:TetR/AcrR family transcriptional regulator [Gammaproteobacteria bacterium]MDH3417496.1 TetR/AcrR family transcriptional regulator [Gammaproteobacteria bacterium]
MSRDTRNRILVASLLLFNEHGEPNTTTNDIADEVDISPGNLHYHFRKKTDLVAALLAEFQADARRVLEPPEQELVSLDDFWVFLHLLLEFKTAYRFLLRDMESLVVEYPKVGNAMRHFARGLAAAFELQLHALAHTGVMSIDAEDMPTVSRNLAVIALFSERFDVLVESSQSADDSALRIAAAVLNVLKPYVHASVAAHLDELATHYAST